MARLPAVLDPIAPRGTRPSTATVSVGGLERLGAEVGQSVAEYQQVRAEADDKEAERLMTTFQQDHEVGLQARAAEWDGQEPGFARREVQQFDASVSGLMDGIEDDGVRLALRRRSDQARAATATRATTLEATRRAEPIRQQQLARRTLQMTGGDIAFNEAYNARIKPLYDGYDGKGEEDLDSRVLTEWDAMVAEVAPSVPAAVRDEWTASMAGLRAKEAAKTLEVEQRTRGFAQVSEAVTQGRQLTNQVLTNPGLFDDNLARIETVGATLPAGEVRERYLTESRAEMVAARVQGLVKAKQTGTAKKELESGVYDAWLEPATKARLLAGLDQPTVGDFLKKGDVKDRANSDINATLTTGSTAGATSVGEVEGELGAADAAEYLRDLDTAKRMYGAVGGLHTLSIGDIETRAEELKPDPKSPDFASQQRVYEQFLGAVDAERKARAADPAAWAMRAGDGGDAGDFLRMKFQAWEGAQGAERPAAARAYAKATWNRQTQAGIGQGQRRVLPKPVAAGLAAGLSSTDGNAKAAAIGRVHGLLAEFGPFAGQVAVELRAAGAPPADIAAAAMTQGNPGRLSPYAAASTDPATAKKLAGPEEKKLVAELSRVMQPYFNSMDALPGSRQMVDARLSATLRTARGLVLQQGMEPKKAAEEAARMQGDFVYRGPKGREWRMPKDQSEALAMFQWGAAKSSGASRVELGARRVVSELVKDQGAGLYIAKVAPADVGRRRSAADWVRSQGTWVTTPAEDGLMLMVPGANGTFAQVFDANGKPVRRSWKALAAGR